MRASNSEVQLIPQPEKANTATPLTALYTSTINIDKNIFAPRIGVAWELGKGTVLRGGYGIFYAKTANSTFSFSTLVTVAAGEPVTGTISGNPAGAIAGGPAGGAVKNSGT
ncbi:MAG: hypothetical protein JWP63_6673, partial [Candidatus Solibacter sp.]|nr:hypothetical protein [Candidatus Solibacter sp.]